MLVSRIFEIQQECSKNSVSAFEKSIGKTPGYLKTIERSGSSPGVDVLLAILEYYPQYSPLWLLTGKGPKKTDLELAELNEPEAEYKKESDLNKLQKSVDMIINQNEIILERLNRSIAKDLIENEKKKLNSPKNEHQS